MDLATGVAAGGAGFATGDVLRAAAGFCAAAAVDATRPSTTQSPSLFVLREKCTKAMMIALYAGPFRRSVWDSSDSRCHSHQSTFDGKSSS